MQIPTKMKGALLLNVVVRESTPVLKLFSRKDKTLLVGGDTFLVLNLGLDVIDGVRGLHLESDSLASQSLNKNLHYSVRNALSDNKGDVGKHLEFDIRLWDDVGLRSRSNCCSEGSAQLCPNTIHLG
jgi:hypothetical protein